MPKKFNDCLNTPGRIVRTKRIPGRRRYIHICKAPGRPSVGGEVHKYKSYGGVRKRKRKRKRRR